ncbi:hypothetical protein ABZ802_31260 [Streptomyces sp. NPDC047737]|uniref:hypothetical protein n=1 Tax=Streptomyces sp. NPDC047737 TaxID=3155740 RepID=UPI003401D703
MPSELMGINITQGGAVALLTLVVLMVLTGRLVPRRTYDDLLKERDTWREAHTVSESARTSERAQTQELLELSRTSAHALQALPGTGLQDEKEVDVR